MAKVLLIMPPYSDVYDKIDVAKMGFVLPSLGLAYIASFLKKHGEDVQLIDASFFEGGIPKLLEKIQRERPEIVGFNSVTANMLTVVKMASEIKRISPLTKIVVGGPHASALPLETMNYSDIDIVVVGEGELTMLELCRSKVLSKIQGILYRDEENQIRTNQARPLIEDLDALPFPLLEDLPIQAYGYLSLGNALPVLSGRGCPYQCSFCASKVINNRRCRFRSPKNFVDELEYIINKFKISKFVFCDESFTLNKKRTTAICEEIIQRKLDIAWSCMLRVDNTNEDVLTIMKQAGCQMIEIGIESADEVVLEKIHKKINTEQVLNVVEIANRLQIEINAFFILGLPFETEASIEKTLTFARKLKIDYAQFSVFTPLPGSEAWELVQEGKVMQCTAKDWEEFSRYKYPIVTSDALSSARLYALHKKAVRAFYLRPYMIFRTLKKMKSPERFKYFVNTGLSLLKFLKIKQDA